MDASATSVMRVRVSGLELAEGKMGLQSG
jgi:hypothetical protein